MTGRAGGSRVGREARLHDVETCSYRNLLPDSGVPLVDKITGTPPATRSPMFGSGSNRWSRAVEMPGGDRNPAAAVGVRTILGATTQSRRPGWFARLARVRRTRAW